MRDTTIRHISDKPGARRRSQAVWIPLGILLVIAAFSLGFWSDEANKGRGVTAVRMRLSSEGPRQHAAASVIAGLIYIPSPADRAASPMNLDSTQYRAALRDTDPETMPDAVPPSTPEQTLVRFDQGEVSLHTSAGIRRIQPFKESSYQDFSRLALQGILTRGAGDFPLFSPHRFRDFTYHGGEILADGGTGGECRVPVAFMPGQFQLELALMGSSLSSRAAKYQEMVYRSAKRFSLNPDLIFAIMRTESAYNPFAVSDAGALGLMQLVPATAGGEVHSYLGNSGLPTGSLLLNPEKNILYGSAYLHLLFTRYFPQVHDVNSREICVIAAYNGGPGAVFRVFNTARDKAVDAINDLSPKDVYHKLTREMPFEESRRYIDKVLGHMRQG